MKCINEEIIQKYIDKELQRKDEIVVENHIAACAGCKEKVRRQQQTASFIKNSINQLGSVPDEIPGFIKPGIPKKQFKLQKFIIGVSAACILVLIFLIQPREKPQDQYIFLYGLEDSFDANKTISQQDMTYFMIDPEGSISGFY